MSAKSKKRSFTVAMEVALKVTAEVNRLEVLPAEGTMVAVATAANWEEDEKNVNSV